MSDAPEPYVSKVDRRTALAWIGVVGAATAVGAGVVVYGPKMGGERITRGYGTDPKLVKPEKAPWSRIMIPGQFARHPRLHRRMGERALSGPD
jgi:hypothetical protein